MQSTDILEIKQNERTCT